MTLDSRPLPPDDRDVAISVVASTDALLALRDDWSALLSRCPGYRFSQSIDWAMTGWQIIGQPRGRSLAILTLRHGGRLVAVWPLVTYREGRVRIVRPLGAEASEYTAPLIDSGVDVAVCAKALWQRAVGLGDLIVLPYLRSGSALEEIVRSGGLWRTADFPAPSLCIDRRDYADWEDYQKALRGSFRRELRRRTRRLGEKGAVSLGPVEKQERAALIDWILQRKNLWLGREGMSSEWLGRRDYRDFLVALAESATGSSGLLIFSLKVDGKVIAATLVTADRTQVEVLIGVYDEDWNPYSPGQILTEHCIAWAFDRGLDYDLRIGEAAYKRDWACKTHDTSTWYVAAGPRALPFVLNRQRVVGFGKAKTWLAGLKRRLKAYRKPPGKA